MALRRGGLRAIRLLQTYNNNGPLQLEALRPMQHVLLRQMQGSIGQQSAQGSYRSTWPGSNRGDVLRYLQTTPERKEEAPRILPDAQQCDEAIEDYTKVRVQYKNLRVPSSYRTSLQRVTDLFATVLTGTVTVLKFIASIPGKLWALRLKSREDWAKSWANAKKTVKEEAHHYWIGTKLLAYDVKVASGLALKAMKGDTLTWRERRQLTRTTADMFRLVPMIIIVAIPFLELLLPVLLKLFPNMLPSTFEDQLKKEEQIKQRLLVKMEVARFLQDTVAEMAKDIKANRTGGISASADELYAFINRVRAGAPVDNADLIKFASLFNDELTLDNLDRVQLVSMCQLLGLPPFGTDGFLRQRLRSHLEKLRQEDRLIQAEGLDALSPDDLRAACKARGMKAAFGDGAAEYMKKQMQGWLELSLNHGLPSSLLLLSRAFTLSAGLPPPGAATPRLESVKETLLTLPEEVIHDVGMEVAAPTTGAEELKKRLHQIQKEQKLIQAEAALQKAAAFSPGLAPAAAGAAAAAATASPTVGDLQRPAQPAAAAAAGAPAQEASAPDATQAAAFAAATAVLEEASAGALRDVMAAGGLSKEELAAQRAEEREKKMQHIVNALAVLASSSGVAVERAKFMHLVRREVERLHDMTHGDTGASLLFTGGALHAVRPEDLPEQLQAELAAPQRLEERVSGILLRIEAELDAAEQQIGSSMHVLDLDNDGLISKAELESALRFLKKNLDEEDLMALLEKLDIKQGSANEAIPVAELISLADQKDPAAVAAVKAAAAGRPIKTVMTSKVDVAKVAAAAVAAAAGQGPPPSGARAGADAPPAAAAAAAPKQDKVHIHTM